MDKTYRQIIYKWLESQPAESILQIIAYFSEYNQLEEVLLHTKNLLKEFYKQNPDHFKEIYGYDVDDPTDETFYVLQRIWSCNMDAEPFITTKDAKQNIKYMMKHSKFARYKIVIEIIQNYGKFNDDDPLFLAWLEAVLNVEHIPLEHIIEVKNAQFDDDDVEDYLESIGKLEQLLNETEHGLIGEHPEYNQYLQEAKFTYNLQTMASEYIDNINHEKLKQLICENTTRKYFPRMIRKYFQFLNSEGFYQMIYDLIDVTESKVETQKFAEEIIEDIIETTLQSIAIEVYGEMIEIKNDPTNEAVAIVNQADQNLPLEQLFDICELSMYRVLYDVFGDIEEEIGDEEFQYTWTVLDSILTTEYQFLFQEFQKAEPIEIKTIFELEEN